MIVGSFLNDTKTNFIAGKSKYLVVEGCEYRRSFLNLSPKILVILNIDADHLDYYNDLDDIKSAFAELTAKLPKDGILLSDFSVIHLPAGFKLKIPGRHNLENAKAALAVARALQIPEKRALKSLFEFSGTWRRFEYRGKEKNGALVYDDYGHHPTAIEATLQGAREFFPTQKIVVVFQPHLYSRTKDHLKGFGKCFARADVVILLPIYPAREQDLGDINSEMVMEAIKKNGKPAYFIKTFAEAAKKSTELAGVGDVIITMGAGETNKVGDILVSE
ncbi:MAG: UDP-N-acetylmuramate--alanine ligase [Parcubacteria group bacterium Gr01-1014_17]|nr:MAG: UDP-N-acetylmuramate--alanine ligase [Parcubacteria group bacterium Gr01-1014_17]